MTESPAVGLTEDARVSATQGRRFTLRGSGIVPIVLVLALVLSPMLGKELLIYNSGLVLIFLVGAIGLHLLVNWAGQLSLAHAAMVALPALICAAISQTHNISPVYLLPLGVVIGAFVGGVIALPTLRAKELQVALVTLIAGTAVLDYFLNQPWLIGASGIRITATPSLGPIKMSTSHALYPVLVVVTVIAVGAAWMLMKSKVGRALAWVRTDPAAASAFGIPVTAYRIGAYAAGGAFAGLAGALTAMWVQNLSPDGFPTTLSFSYLLVVVLAGDGFLGGLGYSTILLQGGPLYAAEFFGTHLGKTINAILTYGGPIALIFIIVQYKSGLNGMGRSMAQSYRERRSKAGSQRPEAESGLPAMAGHPGQASRLGSAADGAES